MVCEYCEKRVKDWDGDDPICAFDHNGIFMHNNWNCACLNELRDLIDEDLIVYNKNSENRLATIPFENGYLIIGWYKNRGRVDFLTTISNDFDRVIIHPKFKDIDKIIKYMKNGFKGNIE